MQCFMDKDRKCEAECVAFVSGPEISGGRPVCGVLDTGSRLIGLATRIFKRQGGSGKHPDSAPPPEVNL